MVPLSFFFWIPILASHFYRNSQEDCKVSRLQTMWATNLASTNNISVHCSSLSTYSNLYFSIFQATANRPHQPVNFWRILLLLLLDTTRSLHRQHQTSTIKLLLLQHLRNHKSESIQKPALPLNPFRHRFLLLQAQSEHFWNFCRCNDKKVWVDNC